MAQVKPAPRHHSNAYNMFILILTIISLVIMVVMLLPLDDATIGLLQFYDNLICVIFLTDFFLTLKSAPKKSDYFIKQGGWLDLLGSVPSLGAVFKYSGILRLARLSRLFRIVRAFSREERRNLVRDVLENRGQYAAIITATLTLIVLTTGSVLVLQFESQSQEANIKSGWDALWYSIVTVTTVGYGDRYPVTIGGRISAIFIMLMGVGIIGALASILASVLVGSSPAEAEEEASNLVPEPIVEQELTTIKNELAELRRLLEKISVAADKNNPRS
jgi:voltage-gated potassium channel